MIQQSTVHMLFQYFRHKITKLPKESINPIYYFMPKTQVPNFFHHKRQNWKLTNEPKLAFMGQIILYNIIF